MPPNTTPSATSTRDLRQRYPEGELVRCVVDRVESFGVFLYLEDDPHAHGFIHRKNWSWSRRILDLGRGVQIGEAVEARVLGHKPGQITLSRRHVSDEFTIELPRKVVT